MSAPRPARLGKGLGAIFQDKATAHRNDPVSEAVPAGSMTVQDLRLDQLEANPFQPRRAFDVSDIDELARSIEASGLLQPILVRSHGAGYQIIAGERRVRAFRHLGRDTIPALVRGQVPDREMREAAIIENIQRVQLNPLEEAMAFQELIQDCGLTHDQLAERLGRSRVTVTNTLRLLRLTEEVRELVTSDKLSAGHARCLASLPPERQRTLARLAVNEGWSVRQMEKGAGSPHHPSSAAHPSPEPRVTSARPGPVMTDFVRTLERRLGTRVTVERARNSEGGSLKIAFHGQDDLRRLGDLLLSSDPA